MYNSQLMRVGKLPRNYKLEKKPKFKSYTVTHHVIIFIVRNFENLTKQNMIRNLNIEEAKAKRTSNFDEMWWFEN